MAPLIMTILRVQTAVVGSVMLAVAAIGNTEPLRVGAVLPLTGVTADYGETIKNAIMMAQDDSVVLREKVKFIFEDAGYDPKQAVSAFKKLVQVDRVDLVYVWGVAFCKALAPLAESARVPMIGQCIDPDVARDRRYVLRFMNYTDQYLRATAQFLAAKGARKLAVVITDNPYLEEMLAALERNLEPGQTVSVLQRYQSNEMDLRSVVSRLRGGEFDAIGIFLSSGQIAAFHRQLAEQSVDILKFGTNYYESLSEVSAAGGAMNGSVFANNAVQPEFVERYRKRYGEVTQIGFGALAFEFAATLGRLLEHSSTAFESGAAVLNAIERMPVARGTAAGPYHFENDPAVGRYIHFPIVMKEIHGHEFRIAAR